MSITIHQYTTPAMFGALLSKKNALKALYHAVTSRKDSDRAGKVDVMKLKDLRWLVMSQINKKRNLSNLSPLLVGKDLKMGRG